MQHRAASSVSSDAALPSILYRSSNSCSSRSTSPVSDMNRSAYEDEDVAMTDSPASSYAPMDIYDSDGRDVDVSPYSATTYQPSSSSPIRPTSHTRSRVDRLGERKKVAKSTQKMSKQLDKASRDARVRELKQKAQSINKAQRPSKAPAPDHQREVLRMVFEQITPYPDDAWISQLALHFNCRYDKIKNWFSNNRQKDAADFRVSYPKARYDLAATLVPMTCEGRELRMRPSALAACPEADWTDSFFYEVVLIHDFRLVVKERNERQRVDTASMMLDMKTCK
ncbi:hypothetical protein HWV62_37865 [Athelia sp. TMB]|nr:hypothetical protein HWV62_37865 [Athelia sp. TMB]